MQLLAITEGIWYDGREALIRVIPPAGRFAWNMRSHPAWKERTAMLVLSRRVGERIRIGGEITITVVRISGGGVRLGIEAPTELPVVREELCRDAVARPHAEASSKKVL